MFKKQGQSHLLCILSMWMGYQSEIYCFIKDSVLLSLLVEKEVRRQGFSLLPEGMARMRVYLKPKS